MKITYNGKLLDISATNLEALILQQAGTDQGSLSHSMVLWCRVHGGRVPKCPRVLGSMR